MSSRRKIQNCGGSTRARLWRGAPGEEPRPVLVWSMALLHLHPHDAPARCVFFPVSFFSLLNIESQIYIADRSNENASLPRRPTSSSQGPNRSKSSRSQGLGPPRSQQIQVFKVPRSQQIQVFKVPRSQQIQVFKVPRSQIQVFKVPRSQQIQVFASSITPKWSGP